MAAPAENVEKFKEPVKNWFKAAGKKENEKSARVYARACLAAKVKIETVKQTINAAMSDKHLAGLNP